MYTAVRWKHSRVHILDDEGRTLCEGNKVGQHHPQEVQLPIDDANELCLTCHCKAVGKVELIRDSWKYRETVMFAKIVQLLEEDGICTRPECGCDISKALNDLGQALEERRKL